jgi:hypothetical protein
MMNPSFRGEGAEDWIAQIAAAVEELCWMSETDAPFDVLHWTDVSPDEVTPAGDLTPAQVLNRAQLPLDTPVEVISLCAFLAPVTQRHSWHTDEDARGVEQFLALQTLLKQTLTQLQVYRCGTTELEIYVVGQSHDSNWLALHTNAVET